MKMQSYFFLLFVSLCSMQLSAMESQPNNNNAAPNTITIDCSDGQKLEYPNTDQTVAILKKSGTIANLLIDCPTTTICLDIPHAQFKEIFELMTNLQEPRSNTSQLEKLSIPKLSNLYNYCDYLDIPGLMNDCKTRIIKTINVHDIFHRKNNNNRLALSSSLQNSLTKSMSDQIKKIVLAKCFISSTDLKADPIDCLVDECQSLAFSHDSKCLASAGKSPSNKNIVIKKLMENSIIELNETDEIANIAFHPANQNILYSGIVDGKIRIWDIEAQKCVHEINTKIKPLSDLLIDPAHKKIISIHRSRTNKTAVQFWDLSDYNLRKKLMLSCSAANVTDDSTVLSPDRPYIAVTDTAFTHLIDRDSMNVVKKFRTSYAIKNAFMLDQSQLAAVLQPSNTFAYNRQNIIAPTPRSVYNNKEACSIAFHPSQQCCVTLPTLNNRINFWDKTNLIKSLKYGEFDTAHANKNSVTCSPDGKYIAFAKARQKFWYNLDPENKITNYLDATISFEEAFTLYMILIKKNHIDFNEEQFNNLFNRFPGFVQKMLQNNEHVTVQSSNFFVTIGNKLSNLFNKN